jgi:hypothetical protein
VVLAFAGDTGILKGEIILDDFNSHAEWNQKDMRDPFPQHPSHNLECDDMVLVMAYVKRQEWGELYKSETALDRGTIFPELDLPFMGKGACDRDD